MWIIAKNYGEEDEAFWGRGGWSSGPFAQATIFLDEPVFVPEGGVAMRGWFNTKERDAHNHSVEGRTELATDLIENLPKAEQAELAKLALKRTLGRGADVVIPELDEVIAENE